MPVLHFPPNKAGLFYCYFLTNLFFVITRKMQKLRNPQILATLQSQFCLSYVSGKLFKFLNSGIQVCLLQWDFFLLFYSSDSDSDLPEVRWHDDVQVRCKCTSLIKSYYIVVHGFTSVSWIEVFLSDNRMLRR